MELLSNTSRLAKLVRGTATHWAMSSRRPSGAPRSHSKEYGDFSLVFETVYYVSGPDYNTYMDIQQTINFSLHEQFEAEGIEFAYPTQTVIMHGSEVAFS